MQMYMNGIVTKETCPHCDNPELIEVHHGHNINNGLAMHDYECPKCGGIMSYVGYPCLDCDPLPNPLTPG